MPKNYKNFTKLAKFCAICLHWVQPRFLLFILVSFMEHFSNKLYLHFGAIRSWIVRVLGEHADHYTNTTGLLEPYLESLFMYLWWPILNSINITFEFKVFKTKRFLIPDPFACSFSSFRPEKFWHESEKVVSSFFLLNHSRQHLYSNEPFKYRSSCLPLFSCFFCLQ